MIVTHFRTLAEPYSTEYKDNGSRFIAFAYPIQLADEVKEHVETLKKEHYKAVHWCYAYRVGVDGLQFRANDDGEPAGSAGRPILGQIDSAELTDVLVVVVRYFGGTLLGVPGLIRAYKTVTAEVLNQAQTIQKNIKKVALLICDYPYLNDALLIAKQHQAQVMKQDLQIDCRLTVEVPLATFDACLAAWQQARSIDIEVL